jgi:transposase
VDTPQQYTAAETERMMKLQDVLLKAMAKKITWWEAAEIIGVTDRTMRRWRERLELEGYSGLVDRRKGKPSDRRVPLAKVEQVLRLYRETYFDLNIRHFHEKLAAWISARHGSTFSMAAGAAGGGAAPRRRSRIHSALPGSQETERSGPLAGGIQKRTCEGNCKTLTRCGLR